MSTLGRDEEPGAEPLSAGRQTEDAVADRVAVDAGQMPDIGFTVAAVARRLGIASATLRTWDRRYGLSASLHTVGAHRRYTQSDVDRLEQVQRLVTRGVPLGSAAAAVLAGVTPEQGAEPADVPEAPGSGVVVALPGGDATTRGLARAATALDSGLCARIMSGSIARRGVIATWDELVRPVLNSIGQRWERTDQGVEVEHALSHSIIAVFAHAGEHVTKPVNERPVILACTTEEQHSLPLYAIYAALAERGIASRVLGARVPAQSLANSIERTGPAAVVVWAHLPGNGEPDYLASLPRTRPAVRVIAAGPGWNSVDTGAFPHVSDLSETVMRVQEALHLG